jgi:hypothetical protein
MQMKEITPQQQRRLDRKAKGLPNGSAGRSERQKQRRGTPEAKKKAKARERMRRKYGRGHCTEIMLDGTRCPNGQYLVFKPQKDGSEKIYRAKWCFAHIPSEFRKRWGIGEFGGDVNHPGRPRKPRPNEVLRELIENEMAEWLAPIREALLATKPTVVGNGRSARIEWSPDHRTRLQAVDSALDRVYGKPKQTSEVSGMINLNADVVVPTDDERAMEVANILAESGALQTAALMAQSQNPLNQN